VIYEAVHDISHEAMAVRVNDKLKDGWEPTGGINVCPEYNADGELTGSLLYSQAIVKR